MRPWTNAEDERLLNLRHTHTYEQMEAVLDRPAVTIRARLRDWGLASDADLAKDALASEIAAALAERHSAPLFRMRPSDWK